MNKLTEILIAAAAVKQLKAAEKKPKERMVKHEPIVSPTHKQYYTVVDIFSGR